jgi:hypothetical protein
MKHQIDHLDLKLSLNTLATRTQMGIAQDERKR